MEHLMNQEFDKNDETKKLEQQTEVVSLLKKYN